MTNQNVFDLDQQEVQTVVVIQVLRATKTPFNQDHAVFSQDKAGFCLYQNVLNLDQQNVWTVVVIQILRSTKPPFKQDHAVFNQD